MEPEWGEKEISFVCERGELEKPIAQVLWLQRLSQTRWRTVSNQKDFEEADAMLNLVELFCLFTLYLRKPLGNAILYVVGSF